MIFAGLLLPVHALRWLLRRLPTPLLVPLDAWSRRIARRRLEQRRRIGAKVGR